MALEIGADAALSNLASRWYEPAAQGIWKRPARKWRDKPGVGLKSITDRNLTFFGDPRIRNRAAH